MECCGVVKYRSISASLAGGSTYTQTAYHQVNDLVFGCYKGWPWSAHHATAHLECKIQLRLPTLVLVEGGFWFSERAVAVDDHSSLMPVAFLAS